MVKILIIVENISIVLGLVCTTDGTVMMYLCLNALCFCRQSSVASLC
jgi:hypothetical protein